MKTALIVLVGCILLSSCRRQIRPQPSILLAYKQYEVLVELKRELKNNSHTLSILDELISFGEELAPYDAELKLIIASALMKKGESERAKLVLEEAITLAPSYSPALRAYGGLLAANGFFKEARDFCLQAVRMNPIDRLARRCAK